MSSCSAFAYTQTHTHLSRHLWIEAFNSTKWTIGWLCILDSFHLCSARCKGPLAHIYAWNAIKSHKIDLCKAKQSKVRQSRAKQCKALQKKRTQQKEGIRPQILHENYLITSKWMRLRNRLCEQNDAVALHPMDASYFFDWNVSHLSWSFLFGIQIVPLLNATSLLLYANCK